MDEDDQSGSSPEFPAIIVFEDGSIGGLSHPDYWTEDVDSWFWSSAGDYLIDARGRKYEQVGDRDDSGRPLAPPTWTFVCSMDVDEVSHLARSEFPSVAGSIRQIVEAICVIDAE